MTDLRSNIELTDSALFDKIIQIMNSLVKKLEKRLLPEFEEVAEKIRQEVPNLRVKVMSFSGGSGIYLGHHFSINCCLKDRYYDDNDCLNLQVSIERLTTTPQINASVAWVKNPIETESFDEFLDLSDEVLDKLYQDLPRLYEALFEALKRRKPADE